jgi:hypothetical protein
MARLNLSLTLGLLAAAIVCQAQEPDLTLPPTIESEPGDVRLEPPVDEREDVLEAVVRGGQTDWRLPDLGSSFRSRIPEKNPNQRIEVTLIPLFDPENQDPTEKLFPGIEDLRRVGFLKIITVGFGKRSRDSNGD